MNRLEKLFEARRGKSKVMNIFITAGYPTIEDSADLILKLGESGADLIELGIPFSDPLADGPTIQYSSEVAISNGVNMDVIFDIVRQVRLSSEIPIVLMGYLNPVLRYGLSKFVENAVEAKVDGLILPDVPIEESDRINELLKGTQLSLIHLVSPTTSDVRMKQADELSSGFIYCVSVTGVTGTREGGSVQKSVERFIDRVNSNIKKNPVLVGFGIKSAEDAKAVSEKADGFIVGSAVINTIRETYPSSGWKEKVSSFVRGLKN